MNTEQATVQGVLSGDKSTIYQSMGVTSLILPNLNLAFRCRMAPRSIPPKLAIIQVSVNGVFGRTPRIEVDRLDVKDNTVHGYDNAKH